MRYFKDNNNEIFAFEEQDLLNDWVQERIKNMTPITEEEVQFILNPLPTLEEAKEQKKREIARARFEEETGGIYVDGVKIKTDRESQLLLMGAALFADKDPTYTINWKGENGWVTLDAETILYLATQVRQHVQSCFDKEKSLYEQIDACTTIEEVQAVEW